MKKRFVAFIGDSFCAGYSIDTKTTDYQTNHGNWAWPSLVGQRLGLKTACYGFGGKSWWYSWQKFSNDWLTKMDRVEAMVFCHTDSHRINSTTYQDLPNCANNLRGSVELVTAAKHYFAYIQDPKFDRWCQERFFCMLRETFSHIKTIHLQSLAHVADINLLPGMIFQTPLIQISIGEKQGSKKMIQNSFQDHRVNHLNEFNNRVLADIITQSVNNYNPGIYELPMEQFDIVNPLCVNYPHGTYWTKE